MTEAQKAFLKRNEVPIGIVVVLVFTLVGQLLEFHGWFTGAESRITHFLLATPSASSRSLPIAVIEIDGRVLRRVLPSRVAAGATAGLESHRRDCDHVQNRRSSAWICSPRRLPMLPMTPSDRFRRPRRLSGLPVSDGIQFRSP
jgi:hypothetical protein